MQLQISWKPGCLFALILLSFFGIFSFQPIQQDPAYHLFVDNRNFFGIPNFLNIISNLAFVFVGGLGINTCLKTTELQCRLEWEVVFWGIALVALGSAYYHWRPSNSTLIWDRLPMTVAFMGLFSAVLAEYIEPCIGRAILLPALIIGLFSVCYWYFSGDLRLYVWVQCMPLLVIAAVLILYQSRYTHQWLLMAALICYLLAKVCEIFDAEIYYAFGQLLSGHTLKHLCAAAACYCLAVMLSNRKIR